jgi:signal transduction histidine kinase
MLLEPRDVRIDAQPGLYALADAPRLLQALTNLVTNAVEHTSRDARISLSSKAESGHVLLRVSDTGQGFPPGDLPHVFERLYRGSPKHTRPPGGDGLGLAITAALVQAMHGSIEVASTVGAGSSFTIKLPLARPNPSREAALPAADRAPAGARIATR